MKVKFWGVWNIRQKRFEHEQGQVWIFFNLKDAQKKIEELGKYAPDNEVLRRVMPIYLTPYDNKQIFEALNL